MYVEICDGAFGQCPQSGARTTNDIQFTKKRFLAIAKPLKFFLLSNSRFKEWRYYIFLNTEIQYIHFSLTFSDSQYTFNFSG